MKEEERGKIIAKETQAREMVQFMTLALGATSLTCPHFTNRLY